MDLEATLGNGQPLVGNWVSLQDPAVAELSAQLGFDFVVLDLEHTAGTVGTITAMARAVDAAGTNTEAIVRVSTNDSTEIKRVLDAGVRGVMAPMIDTSEAAEALVSATRYPPEGNRGVGLVRGTEYGKSLSARVDGRAEAPITIAQIETEAGLENVAEIAAVDGLDGLFVGPADLSAALGTFGEWESERYFDAVDRVLKAGHEAGVPVSTLALEKGDVGRWLDRGFDFLVAGVDMSYVVEGSERALGAFEDHVGN